MSTRDCMDMLLGLLVVVEFFVALDFSVKRTTAVSQANEMARKKDARIADLNVMLEYKTKQVDYLRGLLDEHRIEWQRVWNVLYGDERT